MMRFVLRRTQLAVAAVMIVSQTAIGQTPASAPTPDQARALLTARPELLQQLRQRFATSGMTREQIHARLRQAGYPEDLLDPYLPGGPDNPAAPSVDVFSAVQQLGIADSVELDSLQGFGRVSTDSLLLPALLRDSLEQLREARRRRRLRADVADSIARADSGYNVFGLDIFQSTGARFQPASTGPVDAGYRLGAGDRLVLILTGDVEASYTLDVTREGFIVVPQVGQLYVANLTLADLDNLLYDRLGRVYSGVRRSANATTRFSVSVARLRSNQVFVLGEVDKPGSYMVSSAGTAITALYAAGGPTVNGSLRSIQVRRGNRTVSTIDLYDYLLRGDASNDTRLETGDIIFVPARGLRVRIVGEVLRPATYELKGGETLGDLVRAAGGFRATASRRRIQIERILPPGQRTADGRDRVTMDVESEQLADGNLPSLPLEPGDVVRVFPVTSRVRNTIMVQGNVWAPGRQGLEDGMNIADALKRAGGVRPDVYLGEILVDRLQPDQSRVQLRASLRDTLGTVVGDFPLREDDVIHVFSLADFRPDRYVTIGGAVRKAGRYAYRRGMTMRDLVLLADGLEESAYLKEAEIARLPEDRTGSTTAVTVRVPLDSTYLFERKPGQEYVGAPGLPASASGAPEIELKPYDNVLIMHQPSWELQRTVTITGEVKFPGTYALKSRDERLSDLIQRAGGLTSEAYPEGTVFTRSERDVGRVAIDVPRALKKRNSPENLLLINGDRISVPQRSYVVTVRGAVNAPTVVAYVPGTDIDYYVSQAGGAARNGDRKHVFVTQPNGKRDTKRWAHSPRPLPGSVVEVPALDPAYRTNWLQTIATMTPILASLVTLMLAIKQF